MNNPIQMIKMMMGKSNPQELITNMMGNNNNPMINNLMNMAKKGDNKGIENFARNICKEKGMDFDKEFKDFMKNFQ